MGEQYRPIQFHHARLASTGSSSLLLRLLAAPIEALMHSWLNDIEQTKSGGFFVAIWVEYEERTKDGFLADC